MAPRIVPRAQWGARPWTSTPTRVPIGARRYLVVHYHGGPVAHQRGVRVPQTVEAIHRSNGWSGTGYHWMIDMDGVVYEGRGWDLQGAHCPPRNRDGFGVYLAVGGRQQPTEAALASLRWLYREACRLTGRRLTTGVHGDWWSTDCAGPWLTPWVHGGGLTRDDGPTRGPGQEDIMTPEERQWLARTLQVVDDSIEPRAVETVERLATLQASIDMLTHSVGLLMDRVGIRADEAQL